MVYHWVPIDGHRIRTQITRNYLNEHWDQYTKTQQIFNSYRNEWDLCTEFDPNAKPESYNDGDLWGTDDEINEMYEDDPYYGVRNKGKKSAPKSTPIMDLHASNDIHLYREDLTGIYGDSKDIFSYLDCFNPEDILYYCYGFVLGDPSFNEPLKTEIKWDVLQKILGNTKALISSKLQLPITNFLHQFLHTERDALPQISEALWDLNPRSPHFLRTTLQDNPVLNLSVTKQTLDSTVFFFIDTLSANPVEVSPRHVAIQDAETAIQCLRMQCGPYREDIVRYLVAHGLPFLTLSSHTSPKPISVDVEGAKEHYDLRFRPPRYIPDLVDYAVLHACPG
ncbi:hypothetical protein K439DRAFT_1613787 [Ramaria rubella]|nr:hypothetical protein K439DRAFT_1613787 [Ramaria rubella]